MSATSTVEERVQILEESIVSLNREIANLKYDKASKEELQKLQQQIIDIKASVGEINSTIMKLQNLTEDLRDNNVEITSDIKDITNDMKKIEEKLIPIERLSESFATFTCGVNKTVGKLDDFMETSLTYRLSQVKKEVKRLGDLVKGKGKVHKVMWYIGTYGIIVLVIVTILNYLFFKQGSDFKVDLDFVKWILNWAK